MSNVLAGVARGARWPRVSTNARSLFALHAALPQKLCRQSVVFFGSGACAAISLAGCHTAERLSRCTQRSYNGSAELR
jgi:hypothetical protein